MPTPIAAAQRLWEPAGTYLNTASFGLPPRPAWDALQAALDDWRTGRTSWEHWGDATEAARGSFARLVGVEPATVAVGATVSGLVGLVAASLPDGARVLAPEIEFTSTLFPFLVQARRGVTVRTVPAAELAGAIDDDDRRRRVQRRADGDRRGRRPRRDRRRRAGARRADARRRDPGLRLAAARRAARFDIVVAAGYKWLLSPRGTAYMAVAPERLAGIVPTAAGWYAGEDVHASYFGAAAAARGRRPPARHLARLAQLGRRGARARADRGDRHRRDPRARPRAGEPLPRRARPRAGRLGDRVRRRARTAGRRGSSGRGSGPPCAAAGCGRRGTSTTPTRTSTGRSRRSVALSVVLASPRCRPRRAARPSGAA